MTSLVVTPKFQYKMQYQQKSYFSFRAKVIGIPPMAPVLNTGPPEGIWARNVKFFGKERNY